MQFSVFKLRFSLKAIYLHKNNSNIYMNLYSKIRLSFFFLMLVCSISDLSGQIYFDNASFEGNPEDATMPTGWHRCADGTTPDLLPGPWGVIKEAYDGDTYLGLISRENGTWESIEQRISEPMKRGECYQFSLMLSYTKKYAGYNRPLKLRIWGSSAKCGRNQLLAETRFIKHLDWRKYEFDFYPKNDINYIIFEAYFADGVYISYKGNILIDDLSKIKKCDRAMLEENNELILLNKT
jgi:hypothetical protein